MSIDLTQSFPKSITETDPATGTITYEDWLKDGKWHRADGPAVIERDAQTGIVTLEEWWKHGKYDRADGPAVIVRDAQTGTITHEAWYKNGEWFRPSAEVRAAWIQKEEQQNAKRAAGSSPAVRLRLLQGGLANLKV